MPEVALVRQVAIPQTYEEVEKLVRKAIDLLGRADKFVNSGDIVLIKPNLLLPTTFEEAITTDPRVLQAVATIIKNETEAARVIVGDVPRLYLKARDVMKATGTEEAAKRAGAEIIYLDEEELVDVTIPNAMVLPRTKLPKIVLQADKIIYVPKLKTHYTAKITGAIKAGHGLQVTADRCKFHREDLHNKLVDLLRAVRPDLVVVDAILTMEGQGPAFGNPVESNTIVAGDDPVAVDAVCAAIMGFDPFEIPTIRIAYNAGLGEAELKKISIKGNDIQEVRRNYKRADYTIEGVHAKIETFVGGTCPGCLAAARGFIDSIAKRGCIDKVEKLSIITGLDINFGHEPTGEITFVLGDCAEKYKSKGIFIAGCPPFDAWTVAVSVLEKYLHEKGRL